MNARTETMRTIDVSDMTTAELSRLLGLPSDGEIRPKVRAKIDAFKSPTKPPFNAFARAHKDQP